MVENPGDHHGLKDTSSSNQECTTFYVHSASDALMDTSSVFKDKAAQNWFPINLGICK